MKDPIRLRDSSSDAPAGLRDLLKRAEPTRSMTDAEIARSRAQVEQLLDEPANRLSHIRVSRRPIRHFAYGFAALVAGTTMLLGTREVCVHRCEPLAEPIETARVPNIDIAREREPKIRENTVKNAPRGATNASVDSSDPIANTASMRRDDSMTEKARRNLHESAPSLSRLHVGSEDTVPADPAIPLTPREAIVLIAEANRDLDKKNPAAALARIEKYYRAFPTKSLNADAELVATDALIALGRLDEARARATALLMTSNGAFDEHRVQQRLGIINKEDHRHAEHNDDYGIITAPLDPSVIVRERDRTASIWLRGVGAWQFEANIWMPTGIGKTYRAIVFGDFDADGHLDLAAVSTNARVAWRGLEDGEFGAPIVAGDDMQVEVDDPEENDPLLSNESGDGGGAESFSPFRNRIELEDEEESTNDWRHRWDVMGVEFMLEPTTR